MNRFTLPLTALGLLLSPACIPSRDLDADARGPAAEAESAPPAPPPGRFVAAPPSEGRPDPSGGVVQTTEDGILPAGLDQPVTPAGETDSELPADGMAPLEGADAGIVPGPPTAPPGDIAEPPAVPGPPREATPLPDDLADAPVAGEIVFSDEAEWEVDGVFEPTFEIHTPTASYWVVKPLGTIVSIEDREPEPEQWIAFSSGFRPLRGVPSFPSPPVTRVTTVRDDDSQTPTHVRLTSLSEDGLWQWVWDFYVTHVTLTVNRAPLPVGFAYQGVPGGSLGAEDRLVTSAGVSQGARSSFNADLEGPVEWAYLADTTLGRSLFGIQHRDDALPERYQVRDNDTSLFSFGNGLIDVLPARFSLGLIPSVNHQVLSDRVAFISGSIR
jgi:hypothetical protein